MAILAKRFPNNPTVKMEPAYMFPAVAMSNEEIVEWRERFMRNLDRLISENFTVRDPEWRVLTLPFYQGYHGQNNLPLMNKMAEFFLHSCRSSISPQRIAARRRRGKTRCASASSRKCSIPTAQPVLRPAA